MYVLDFDEVKRAFEKTCGLYALNDSNQIRFNEDVIRLTSYSLFKDYLQSLGGPVSATVAKEKAGSRKEVKLC